MDTPQSTATPRSRYFQPDISAPRKAFLDTYAKQRSGPATATTPDVQTESPITIEAAPAEPTLVDVLQSQHVTQPTPVQSIQPVQPRASATAVATDFQMAQPTSEQRRAHLDTLFAEHKAKVQTAPMAEDTITAPQLTDTTQHLIEDGTHQRITANLNALYNKKPLTDHVAKTSSTNAAHVKTIIASALACGVLSVGIISFTTHYGSQPVVAEPIGTPIIEVEAPAGSTPTGQSKVSDNGAVYANPTDPVKLIISSIGVNARVDGLGTTPDGLIAVPKSYGTAGWYNKGATVGQVGPAVFVGHYTGGGGGVFDKLGDVNAGDLVTVQTAKGESFTYRVAAKAEYDKDKVPMNEIFKKGSTSRLEIITCSGKWQSNNYNKRLVVTAELVQ